MKKNDGNWASSKWVFMAGAAALAGMAAFLLFSGKHNVEPVPAAEAPVAREMPSPGGSALTETRPVLPYSDFTGRVANAYRIAAEIPGAVDGLYCYCKCKENPMFRHKTLLTCYTNNHAADCDICMHEAEMAADLTKQGKTPKEIRVAVDDWYAKHPNL
ncbi:MAG: hypothetical protein HY098_02500 [Nitrospinae bacterium]|nr:hypothetical protein [Nitrospinota bacterium]